MDGLMLHRRKMISSALHAESAEGNPLTFETNVKKNLKECVVEFTPKQSGSGTPSIDNVMPISGWTGINVEQIVSTGKNLLPSIACNPRTASGITFSQNSDGSVHVVGTATAEVLSHNKRIDQVDESYITWLDPGTYTVSAFGGRLWMQYSTSETLSPYTSTQISDGASRTYTFTERTAIFVRVDMLAKDGAVDKDCMAMVELGSSATEYEPYNFVKNTFTCTWETEAGEVFGGSLNLTTGELTASWMHIVCGESITPAINNRGSTGGYAYGSELAALYFETGWTSSATQYFKYAADYDKLSNAVSDKVVPTKRYSSSKYPDGTNIAIINIKLPTECGTSRDTIRAYLADNPLELAYPLKNPIVYQLTPTQIKTLLGENVLTTDGNTIKVKYWKH